MISHMYSGLVYVGCSLKRLVVSFKHNNLFALFHLYETGIHSRILKERTKRVAVFVITHARANYNVSAES